MGNNFAKTRNLYIIYTSYTEPLSFNQWNMLPDDHKAAVLFVQFYDQITLAWYKLSNIAPWIPAEDGVSTMCQYLHKNVPIISADSRKFTPNYIYRVAYNCLYCITIDPQKLRERAFTETSNIAIGPDNVEYDLYDTASSVSAEDEFEDSEYKRQFWQVIEDAGLETQKVVNYLLNGEGLGKVNKRCKSYKDDPLRDIQVDAERLEEIIADLKRKLARFVK